MKLLLPIYVHLVFRFAVSKTLQKPNLRHQSFLSIQWDDREYDDRQYQQMVQDIHHDMSQKESDMSLIDGTKIQDIMKYIHFKMI